MTKRTGATVILSVILIAVLIPIFVISFEALIPHWQPASISHHGIIEGKFTAIDQGTTTYHLLVNESGTLIDVQTDSVTWYGDSKIGSEFVWETKNLPRFIDVFIPLIGSVGSLIVILVDLLVLHEAFLAREANE